MEGGESYARMVRSTLEMVKTLGRLILILNHTNRKYNQHVNVDYIFYLLYNIHEVNLYI